jgi:ATP-dependent Clp protease ATP-binding subunit ClpA
VQEQLLNPLSMKLLEGDFKPGDRIKVTTKDDELIFQKK